MGENGRPTEGTVDSATVAIGASGVPPAHAGAVGGGDDGGVPPARGLGRPRPGGHDPASHDVPVIPGLDDDAAANSGEELYDPEKMRRLAAPLGQRMYAVDYEFLFGEQGAITSMYKALAKIRKGAVRLRDLAEGTEYRRQVHSTETKMEAVLAEGGAAKREAEELHAEFKESQQRREEADKKLEEKKVVRAKEEEAFEQSIQTVTSEDVPVPKRPRSRDSVFALVQLDPKALAVVLPVELFATTVLLKGPISDLVPAGATWESWVAAGASGAGLLGLGMVAGYAAAAMRLPARVMGMLIVALSILLFINAEEAMTLLRLGDEDGVELLTIATLAAATIGAVTAFAVVTYAAAEREAQGEQPVAAPDPQAMLNGLDMPFALGHPLNAAARRLMRARKDVDEAQAERDHEAGAEDAGREEIMRLMHIFNAMVPRALEVKQAGIEAGANLADLEASTDIKISQEDANADACIDVAGLDYARIRTEGRADSPEAGAVPVSVVTTPNPSAPTGTPSWLRPTALACGAAGGILGALLPSVPMALGGVGLAALLWLISSRAPKPMPPVTGEGRPAPGSQRPSIQPMADTDNLIYRELPSSTVPKGRRGPDEHAQET